MHRYTDRYCTTLKSSVEHRTEYHQQYRTEKFYCGWWIFKSWVKCPNCIHSLRRKQNKKPSANLKTKLANAELNLQKDMSAAKAAFESSLVHNFANTNSSKIFKYISSITNSCTLPTTMCFNDISDSSDKGIAQLFNNYFFSVYTENCPLDFSVDALSNINNDCINDVYFTPYDIFNILSSLDLNKAMGFDRLSPKVFRYCAPALYLPIYHLFSQCFQQSSLPHEWKIHCITPIFKSGDRTMVSNYTVKNKVSQ